MVFNSMAFLLFFLFVILIYFFLPRKIRYIWLLVSSYYLYSGFGVKYAIILCILTVISYVFNIIVATINDNKRKLRKFVFLSGVSINILTLIFFKYFTFLNENINSILKYWGKVEMAPVFNILAPVGVSFFIFQMLGYSIDVYRRDLLPERNIFKYALFISYFPKIVQGPIERGCGLIQQINTIEQISLIDFNRIRDGLCLMLYGFFTKLVLADRMAIYVNQVFSNYGIYSFWEISIASILFSLQIYCDFNGYTNIAIGASQIMGIKLQDNFRQPYLSISIKDFWKRWHISLTSWFRDYLYIPLGGNRKGTLRKYINIMIIFLTSGLWHGASWNFIVWGALHGIYQIIGDIKFKISSKFFRHSDSFSKRFRKRLICFLLVCFTWIFFRADGLKDALMLFSRMTVLTPSTSIFLIENVTYIDWLIIIVSLLIVFTVDFLHEKQISIRIQIYKQELWFRWLIYFCAFWVIVLLGIYGSEYTTSQFIYTKF